MIQYSVNHGLTGGTLVAYVPEKIPGAVIYQWRMLWERVAELTAAGYGVDADRLLDILMEWDRTGEWPTNEDLEFLND